MKKDERILSHQLAEKISISDLKDVSAAMGTLEYSRELTNTPNGDIDMALDVHSDI